MIIYDIYLKKEEKKSSLKKEWDGIYIYINIKYDVCAYRYKCTYICVYINELHLEFSYSNMKKGNK